MTRSKNCGHNLWGQITDCLKFASSANKAVSSVKAHRKVYLEFHRAPKRRVTVKQRPSKTWDNKLCAFRTMIDGIVQSRARTADMSREL